MQVPPELSGWAARQWGLVTRQQALAVLSPAALRRRVESGVLVPETRGLYRLAGAPRSWRQRAMAACLHMEGDRAVSHLAAAYLWQARSVAQPDKIQLTVPPGRRSGLLDPKPYRRPLPAADVTARWGIPATTPARTIIDLSQSVEVPLLGRVLDDLVRSKHLRLADLAGRLASKDPLPRYGRAMVEEVLALRLARGVGASPREDWLVDALWAAGVELPERNVIVEAGGRLYEVDLAYPARKIAIEYDGVEVHRSGRHFYSDREKAAVLQLGGWLVLQVTAAWSAAEVVERVGAALRLRPLTGESGQ